MIEDVNKLDDNGVGYRYVTVTAESLMQLQIVTKPQAARCFGSSLLGHCGNRQAALISLRSSRVLTSRAATDSVDSGLLLSDVR